MPPKRMTANPLKPSRHRAGKQTGAESSDSDSDTEEATTAPVAAIPPPPAAASAGKIISNLSKVDLNARRQEAQVAEAQRLAAENAERLALEEGFVTEEEEEDAKDDDDPSDGSEEEDSDSEEDSSEDEAPRRMMMRPKFVPKSQRAAANGQAATEAEEEEVAARQKKAAADALVEEQIKKDLAARAAGKKHWEDDDDADGAASDVDTTDGLDPAAEEAQWRVRELKRVRRARAAIEEREAELAEVERRRNLTAEERAAEDAAFLEGQQRDKDAKGRAGYMQRYFHKGAFFREEAEAAGLLQRDLMGARVEDDVRDREALPAYLQRRDMTKLGRKGATKYRDMRTEDTGSWGGGGGGARRGGGGGGRYDGDERFRPDDERFRPDDPAGGRGANAMPLGERRRDGGGGGRRSRSRSRSPRRERDEYRGSRKRSSSRDRGEDKRRRVEADR
ncbi:microfibrillar-associated protein MfaP1 [Cordyceps fumosorosea ARSEF 2679]|uniref:Microfibrillar-associated protein MfaP1 n=1 Tax=Cordyceps fumosorosea (strain ARSEF 2679) TaxID=1081104 RepID=A0A168EPY7_CORFA|nr:microfibrillar-associated protein MfaP1 [Cordyceps fumosorosea ARSEF 2679]OAA74081.1 microfibrillar-associated protein MfaP1 [Cordyceps fumosorosea ARSEF 2679]